MEQWKDFGGFSNLGALSEITVRLLRLSLYNKLQRGEAQLRALGLAADFKPFFRELIQKENVQFKDYNKSETRRSVVVKRKRNDF